MATGMAGIFNQLSAARAALEPKSSDTTGAGSTSGSSGSAGSDSATISANDFLTLLVTEMKNQDPTANTDPNEYINQLVQVNSLEQLISINQTLTADSKAGTTGGSTRLPETQPATSLAASTAAPLTSPQVAESAGNLSIPHTAPAAMRVAESLGAQSNRQ